MSKYSADTKHKARVAAMPCICCELLGMEQESRTSVHHIREGQGGQQRADHFLTIPLCEQGCHQGPNGIHGDRSYLRILKMTELDLLAETLRRLFK